MRKPLINNFLEKGSQFLDPKNYPVKFSKAIRISMTSKLQCRWSTDGPFWERFCSKATLIFLPISSMPPIWTNVQYPTEVAQGPNISDDQLEKLNTEIEAFSSCE